MTFKIKRNSSLDSDYQNFSEIEPELAEIGIKNVLTDLDHTLNFELH